MKLYENSEYIDDVSYVAGLGLPWKKLQDSSIMLSGATGQIGSFLIDVIMYRNLYYDMGCRVYALGRSEERARERFYRFCESELYRFARYDVRKPFAGDGIGQTGYILHLASNTHPVQYAADPIGTITTNITGMKNMLDFAVEHHVSRCIFASSNEIYGENRGDVELFDEDYCGYINSNTMRAGYPESKRCGEALCQAFIKQKGLDIVIPRLTRSYGPTLLASDTKALSQFLHKALAGEDIVLKSAGNQYYSYTYIADAVSGLLTVMLKGGCGEAYNIADEKSDIRLKDLAEIVAGAVGRKVVFEIPDDAESAGYSTATKARLDGNKLKKLGWSCKYDIETGIIRTIKIMREIMN